MIGRLTGDIVDEGEDGALVVDVQGVGYEVFVPLGTRGKLAQEGPVTLHIHTHVREDQLVLYGFPSGDDRRVYRLLLGVNGVGPKVALAVLSKLDAHGLAEAVARQDRAAFKGVSGVGKKTAERLLLDLRDKTIVTGAPKVSAVAAMAGGPAVPLEGSVAQAVGLAVGMGYKRDDVERLAAVMDDDLQGLHVDKALRELLKNLG